jgi:hypothetical protein
MTQSPMAADVVPHALRPCAVFFVIRMHWFFAISLTHHIKKLKGSSKVGAEGVPSQRCRLCVIIGVTDL